MKVFVCILATCLLAAGAINAELGYAYAPPISTVHQHLGASSNQQQVATSYNPPASGSNYNQHQHHQHHHVQQQQQVQQQLPALTVAQTYAPVQQQQIFSAPAPVQQQTFTQQTYSAPAQQQQQQQTFTQQTFSAPAQQQSFLSGSSSSHSHQYTTSAQSVPTIVQKHIYVHVPPPDTEADQAAALAQQQFVQPKKHYKIIFIKAPAQQSALPSPAALAQAQAATEEKTIVYVLVKKPDEQADYEAAASALPAPPPSKPEVYFIKYKNQAVAAAAPGGSLGVDVRNNFAGAQIVGEQELSGSSSTLTGFTGITAPVQQQQQQQQTVITTTSQVHSHSHAGETLSTSQSQQAGQHVQVPAPVYGPVH